ncbi:DUF3232 domain-containing protein [Thermoanaerobacter thermohydrosulfuricus]
MLREKFNVLVQRIKDEAGTYWKEDLESVEDSIKQCGRYIKTVNDMESAITSARFRMEPEDYREYIMNLDRSRKIEHDALIVSVRVLNRLCSMYRVDPIFIGDLENRIEIAEFAKAVVDEMFETRQM